MALCTAGRCGDFMFSALSFTSRRALASAPNSVQNRWKGGDSVPPAIAAHSGPQAVTEGLITHWNSGPIGTAHLAERNNLHAGCAPFTAYAASCVFRHPLSDGSLETTVWLLQQHCPLGDRANLPKGVICHRRLEIGTAASRRKWRSIVGPGKISLDEWKYRGQTPEMAGEVRP